MSPPKIPIEVRFWKFVERIPGVDCWIWMGTTSKTKHHKGAYPKIWYEGGSIPAHRVSWELANKTRWPLDKVAMHTCDVPLCVNPDHIRPGTLRENTEDAVRKGRWPSRANGRSRPAKATHCRNHHEFTEENAVWYTVRIRGCRACRLEAARVHRVKKRLLAKDVLRA